jgi:pimeloyl-ACP methyl ester carboxylesterase
MPPHPALQPYARSAVVDGTRLFYYDAGAGDGPPLLLVHGLGDEADTWWRVLPWFARRRRVLALDLPGFGRSDHPRRAYTTGFFARSVAGLLAALGIGRAVLVGHSMGAAVVQRLALARPDMAERLVLIDGGLPTRRSYPRGPIWLFLAPGLGEAAYTSLRRSQDQAYATLRPYYRDLDALPAEDRAFLRERVWARVWSDGQRRAFLSALRWMAIDQAARAGAFRERLARMPIPTRILWGDGDQIAPPAAGSALAELLPNAELRVVAGGGHNLHQERPAEVIDALLGPYQAGS